jgi:hypothetical protein
MESGSNRIALAVDEILANLVSLSIEPMLTDESYQAIAKAGFREDNGTLAAIICQELVESNPVTLRGLFYRVVSTGFLPSTSQEHYSRVGRIVTRMRRCGLIEYDWIVDSLRSTAHRPGRMAAGTSCGADGTRNNSRNGIGRT